MIKKPAHGAMNTKISRHAFASETICRIVRRTSSTVLAWCCVAVGILKGFRNKEIKL